MGGVGKHEAKAAPQVTAMKGKTTTKKARAFAAAGFAQRRARLDATSIAARKNAK